jgi:hypothetical protein
MADSADQVATAAVVDVPSGLTGFVLVMRLHDNHAYNKQATDGTWHVHVELADADELPALLTTVGHWQRSEQVRGTTVHVGDDVYQVAAAPQPV